MGLVNLSDRDSARLAAGAVDVRGWKVRTEMDGEKVGTVDDLLLDDQDRPHFYDVDLGAFRKHVLLPVSEAHADPAERVLWVDRMDRERLREVPRYDHHPELLTTDFEERLRAEYRLLAKNGNGTEVDAKEALESNGVETVAKTADGAPRLARLGDLKDYKVAKGVADPRGWKVLGGDGHPIGEVNELIVEPIERTARFLDVRVDEKKLELEPLDRHILVPVERVRLERKSKRVVVDGLFAKDAGTYPVYRGLPLDLSESEKIKSAFKGHAPDERRLLEGEARTIHAGDEDVHIRISGDDIIVERRPRGENGDG